MIRINLLPVREERRRAAIVQQLAVLGVAVAVAALGSMITHLVVSRDISGVKTELVQTRNQIDGYKDQLQQVKEYRRRKEDVESKLAVISQLEQLRSGPVHVMDELATRSPRRLWITSFDASGQSVKLGGMGLNNQVVASFLTALNDSPYFGKVELDKTELTQVGGLKLSKFGIRATLTHPGAVAQ